MIAIRSLLAVGATLVWVTAGEPTTEQRPDGFRYADLPAGAYAVVAEVRAKPGKADALRAITLPLVAQVRRETNNLLYFAHEDLESPGHFVFYEIFVTKADFEAHNATPHVTRWLARLPELADGGVRVIRMGVLANTTPASPRRAPR